MFQLVQIVAVFMIMGFCAGYATAFLPESHAQLVRLGFIVVVLALPVVFRVVLRIK